MIKRIALAALAAFVVAGSEAQAQFQIAPGLNAQHPFNAAAGGFNPYTSGNFFNRGLNPYAGGTGGYNTMTSSPGLPNPFSPYYPYTGYYQDPYSSQLYGSASVINSLGQYQISTQQTYLLQQQVKREKIENRRRMFDEWLYERNNTPSAQDEFERAQKLELRRSQNDPPVNEILSAKALNDLLIDLQKLQGKEVKAQDVPLDEQVLKHINVSPPGKGGANAGILKNEGKLKWPLALRGNEFRKERDLLNTLTPDAVNQAVNGQVDAGTLKAMTQNVDKLLQELAVNIKEMPPSQYIEAKRFLNDFKDGLNALGRDDAAHYFTGKYRAQGKSVAELVRNMTQLGLRFTPAVPGDESAYVALHRMLAAYDVSANSAVVDQR